MSYKYIPQLNETNFVYPNYEISEYDVDILHSINNNSVTGTVTNFVVSGTARTTGITLTHNYTWSQNGAERFISSVNTLRLFSVHVLAPGQTYYKPWRIVEVLSDSAPFSTSYSSINNFFMTPSQLGITAFTSGTYFFEFRFIGLKAIYPVCASLQITVT